MGRVFKSLAAAVLAAVLAAALVGVFALQGWGRAALAPAGDAAAFAAAAKARLQAETKGNAAFVLVKAGQPVSEAFFSKGAPVDRDTQFQVASLSKWVTALGVMTLVERGKLDLDAPVSRYLTRWKLPASAFDNEKVTVRRLLSHTAGLTDGLGYGGFAPGAPIQSLEGSLTHAADADDGATGAVRVGLEPGAQFEYSGGGYALLQLIVEEVSGQPFNAYMTEAVLAPLGMTRSTYVLGPEPTDLAASYATDGSSAPFNRFTAVAATSLFTTAADLTRLVAAHWPGPNGEPVGRGVLRPDTLVAMRKPQAQQFGADIWGLGVVLYAPNNRNDFVIGHDGNNGPAINTAVRLDPATGDGVVVLETGDKLAATKLAGAWEFWATRQVDLLTLTMEAGAILRNAALAAGGGFLVAFALVWRWTRRRTVDALAA